MPASPIIAAETICSWLIRQGAALDGAQLDDIADFTCKLLDHMPLEAGRVRALAVAPGLVGSDLDMSWPEAEACRTAWLRQGHGIRAAEVEQHETRALDQLADVLIDFDRVDDLLRLVAGIGLTRTRWTPSGAPTSGLICAYIAFCSDRHPVGVVGALPVPVVRAGDDAA